MLLLPGEKISIVREQLSKLFGVAFAKKATDEFCESYLKAPTPARRIRRESLDITSRGNNVVVTTDAIIEFKEDVRAKEMSLSTSDTVNEKVAEVLKEMPELARMLDADLRKLEYRKKAKQYKENAIGAVQSINAYLEKEIEKSYARETTQKSF